MARTRLSGEAITTHLLTQIAQWVWQVQYRHFTSLRPNDEFYALGRG